MGQAERVGRREGRVGTVAVMAETVAEVAVLQVVAGAAVWVGKWGVRVMQAVQATAEDTVAATAAVEPMAERNLALALAAWAGLVVGWLWRRFAVVVACPSAPPP